MGGGHDQRPGRAPGPSVRPARVDDHEPSTGIVSGVLGVVLLLVGSLLTANVPLSDNPDLTLVAGTSFLGDGLYCIVAGAVARGLQIARRATPPPMTPVTESTSSPTVEES